MYDNRRLTSLLKPFHNPEVFVILVLLQFVTLLYNSVIMISDVYFYAYSSSTKTEGESFSFMMWIS